MTVGQYLTITNQGSPGQMRYSFCDSKPTPERPPAPAMRIVVPLNNPRRYPPPGGVGPSQTPETATGGQSLLHPGFSVFTSSFAILPPAFDGSALPPPG
jgi:hypothetical protein